MKPFLLGITKVHVQTFVWLSKENGLNPLFFLFCRDALLYPAIFSVLTNLKSSVWIYERKKRIMQVNIIQIA